MSYNNNDWGPALDKDGNPVKEEKKTNKICFKDFWSGLYKRQSAARRFGDDNADIIQKIMDKELK